MSRHHLIDLNACIERLAANDDLVRVLPKSRAPAKSAANS